jgi:pimeloyl-ACP methyl ester carboxylesterase
LFSVIPIFLSAATPARAATVQERVVELDLTRGPVVGADPAIDVKVRYVLIEVDSPVGTLVLFTGGSGKLRLALNSSATIGRINATTANFLVRSRWPFASAGPFSVVVIDAATDFESLSLGLRGNRTSNEHQSDIADIISDLPNQLIGTAGPICLVGTSRGTISAAAYAAIRSNTAGPAVDCLVLTSSVTQPGGNPANQNLFDDVPLDLVAVPSLVVAHKKDECFVTPPEDAKELGDRLRVAAPTVQVKRFSGSGGTTELSDECGALSAHGFFGIEQKVINFIGRWIKHNF